MSRSKAAVALLLTFAAGCVDIIGYLTLYRTFTAHMTGVTVHLGRDVSQSFWPKGAILLAVLASFVGGSILGRIVVEIGLRHRLAGAAAPALAMEFTLLALVSSLGALPEWKVGMILLIAAAMGIQTAALTRVGSLTVHTTFVTGMLNKLAQLLSHALFLAYDELRGRPERRHLRSRVQRQALFIFAVWALYFAGAASGTLLALRWGTRSLLIPAAVVMGVAAFDILHPLAIEEERDQPER